LRNYKIRVSNEPSCGRTFACFPTPRIEDAIRIKRKEKVDDLQLVHEKGIEYCLKDYDDNLRELVDYNRVHEIYNSKFEKSKEKVDVITE